MKEKLVFAVDPEATPVDFDLALALFLLAYVRRLNVDDGNESFEGFGNNPWPLATLDAGQCCDNCNWTRVMPARFSTLKTPVDA